MKKLSFLFSILFALCLFVAPASHAQQRDPGRTNIKLNVLSPFALTASGFVEHAISPRVSLQLNAFVTGVEISGTKFSGYGFTPELRYYLTEAKQAPVGFYVSGYGRIQHFDLTADNPDDNGQDYSATYTPIGLGVATGGQWVFNSGFVVDAFFGIGYNSGSVDVQAGDKGAFDVGFVDGVGLRPGVLIGYNF